jgi:hypothetical protein
MSDFNCRCIFSKLQKSEKIREKIQLSSKDSLYVLLIIQKIGDILFHIDMDLFALKLHGNYITWDAFKQVPLQMWYQVLHSLEYLKVPLLSILRTKYSTSCDCKIVTKEKHCFVTYYSYEKQTKLIHYKQIVATFMDLIVDRFLSDCQSLCTFIHSTNCSIQTVHCAPVIE